ncbi:hypothetical protein DMN91_012993 [Ooceraea biroi]|uniref:Dynein regulatory complex protein 9 n=1 Tax=Ooceraea biroi TaxID=2015173 RepID=A0A3L8D4E5_OOCBI|nr:hypothetical protein DMN91_012993 [Ooceraea biroi]
MHASQDVQAFQRDVALDRLSSITLQQARRKVTLVDNVTLESMNERTIEKALKQTADIFMQNLDKVSKMDMNDDRSSREEHSEDRLQMELISPVDLLTPLEAAAISRVLEECLEQLLTVGFVIPASVDPRWDETGFKTVDEAYGVPDEPRAIFREDMGLLPLVPTAAEKMQRDRNYVRRVLERVLRDVRDDRKFDSLQEELDSIARKREGERDLETSARAWLNRAGQLRGTLESSKTASAEDTESTIRLAQESDAAVDRAIFLNSGKLGYAERWARARLEQQALKLQLRKTDVLNGLSDRSKECNAEQIMSAEISAYLEADIEEKEKQIVAWTTRYSEELVRRQQEIDELKEKVDKQKLEMDEMRSLRDEQRELIDEYISEERRLREEAEHRGKLHKAATVIQSRWRGHMVRRELGKYKNLRKRLKRRKKLSKKFRLEAKR